jgi:hypothetical protein
MLFSESWALEQRAGGNIGPVDVFVVAGSQSLIHAINGASGLLAEGCMPVGRRSFVLPRLDFIQVPLSSSQSFYFHPNFHSLPTEPNHIVRPRVQNHIYLVVGYVRQPPRSPILMSATSNGASKIVRRRVPQFSSQRTKNVSRVTSQAINGHSPYLHYTFSNPQQQFRPGQSVMASETSHPMKTLFRQQWNERDRSALIQWVNCPVSVDSHAVVRRYHARRVKQALFDSLRAKGMDTRGKPLEDSGRAQRESISPVQGSLEIILRPDVKTATFPDLKNELRKVVEKIYQRSRAS